MPTTYVQTNRPLAVATPLGKDVLLLVGFTGHEAVSQLFNFQLDLIAEKATPVPFDKLLGQQITVALTLPDGKTRRFFNGLCSRLTQGGSDDTFTSYRMEVVPQLWLLTRRAQSRIFQHLSVPDILKKVLAGLDVEYQIQGTFHPRDYCVQYRETDFNFASRLMEEEGIFWFFKHGEGGHKLVVANTPACHPELPGGGKVLFESIEGGNRDEDRVHEWAKSQELRSGKVTLWDHCFELPHKHLEASAAIPDSVPVGAVTHKLKVGGNEQLELYDYPGEYAQRFDGIDKGGGERAGDLKKIFEDNKRTAELRMQEEALPSLLIEGAGACRHFVSGHRFTLERHPNGNGAYVLTGVRHQADLKGDYRSNGSAKVVYRNRFTCIPLGLPYRPPRRTPRPFVQGTQTAVVVGPKGEEIFCDKYGRVKVQFHWDRQGKYDADSSCWVRVATTWGGKGWGFIQIPRVGQEVVVDFLEGDPDNPIIVGSVFNAETMPAFGLPDGKVISGLKTNSTPGGGGYNELIFDDTKGKELVRLHGQYDMESKIKHDKREEVLNDRSRYVKNNEMIKIDVNQTETIGGCRVCTVSGNDAETIKIAKALTVLAGYNVFVGLVMHETVGGARINEVGGYRAEVVGGYKKEYVRGRKNVTIGSNLTENFKGKMSVTVGRDLTEHVKGTQNTTVDGDLLESVKGKYNETVSGAYGLEGKGVTVNSTGDQLVLVCGGASITLEKGGKIVIKGTDLTVEGSGAVKVQGAKIDLN